MRKNPAATREELTRRVLEQHVRLLRSFRMPHTVALLAVELTMPQLKTLLLLDALGSTTAGQLARRLGVSLSTMTGIVDRMCDQGVVTRGEDPDDRRATRVRLTDAGRDLAERLDRGRVEVVGRILDRLSLAQLEQVERAFGILLDAADFPAADAGEDAEPGLYASRPRRLSRAL